MKKTAIAALLFCWPFTALATSFDDLNAGIQMWNLDDWKAALPHFDRALAAGDLSANLKFTALLDRAYGREQLGQVDDALADYTAALTLRPDSAYVMWARSELNEKQKKYDDALTDLNAVVAARPLRAGAFAARARVNMERSDIPKVRDDLRSVLSLMPEDSKEHQIGILQWQLENFPEAERQFSWSAGRHNLYGWLWLSLVDLHNGKAVPRRDVPDYEKGKWPAPIVNFFLGEGTQQEVFDQAAGSDDTKVIKGRVCEANFYVGEWLLLHNEAAAAAMIRKAAGDCPTDFVEWSPAQLAAKGLP